MRVLLTGAGGQLGTDLRGRLAGRFDRRRQSGGEGDAHDTGGPLPAIRPNMWGKAPGPGAEVSGRTPPRLLRAQNSLVDSSSRSISSSSPKRTRSGTMPTPSSLS